MSFRYVKLGSLFDITSGGTPSRKNKAYYENGDIPWVKTGDLKNMYLVDADEYITQQALNESSAKLFPKGTVLIAMYGATIGNCSILSINAATNQACAAFKPNNRIIPEFLYYYLTSIKEKLISLAVGGAQPNISISILRNIEIPLLTINQQERVVSILNKSKELIDKRKAQIEALEQLVQSLFWEMFGTYLTSNRNKMFFGELVKEFRYGTSVKSGEFGYPILRIPNIVNGIIDESDLKYCELPEKDFLKLKLQENDLLFVRTNGNPNYVGRCASVTKKQEGYVYASYLIRARIDLDKLNTEYVTKYMNSVFGRHEIIQKATTSAGQYNINTEGLGNILIPVPPLNLQ
ncbi:restriction endonuclease subunit S [Geobacillus icigianus]|uniref:Type-1 restriction enzyme EcoKI specificity protein n=2 Tax=Geobacillus TaxID=129337 RepID=A0ABU6BJH3_9BACL|nr:restriction endonuclease subunit S [Geobacillus icigianus]MEB3752094.1 Type-1 restriction enzyme EcoKI specificity protein [Geobacillus icigianus]